MSSDKDIRPDEGGLVTAFGGGAQQNTPAVSAAGFTDVLNLPSGTNVYSFNKPLPSAPFKLPSLGRMYPGRNVPETIRLDSMTTRQLLILNTPALWSNDEVFPMILRECVKGLPSGFDVTELYPDDYNAILIALRMVSFGRKYEVRVKCPKITCQHEYPHTVDLEADFDVTYLDEKKKVQIPIEIKPEWLREGKRVLVRPITWKQDMEIDARDEWRKKNMDRDPTKMHESEKFFLNQRIMDELETGIVEVEGIGNNSAVVQQWLMELNANDASIIRQMMNKYKFGVKNTFAPKACPSCGEKFTTTLPISFDFFRATLPEAALE
jgi:hypothetical protein